MGRLSAPTLIGRDREHRLLVEAVVDAPVLIAVEGEAGVGKSRLVREALSSPRLAGCRVLMGHCHRLREPFLLGPVVEALRGVGNQPPARSLSPVAGALQPLLPELAAILPPAPDQIGDARAERHRVFRGLRELLGGFGPVACVLEDLHWADEGTLEFLSFLLSQPPDGLALVLTYRTEDLPRSSPLIGLGSCGPRETPTRTIALAPLGVEDVRLLVGELLETDNVSMELARSLHEATAGIPFALEEVVRLLRDGGQLPARGSTGTSAADVRGVGVPPAIRQSIAERLEPLTADAQAVTRAAAVLAVAAGEDLLADVAGLPAARARRGLTRALASGLLQEREAGSYGFRHVLAAQAVYDEVRGPERRQLHLRAAQALQRGPDPRPLAQLAHHFKEADRPQQWARCAEAAADAAASAGDDRVAARLLEDALTADGATRAARVRMAVKLGSAAPYSDSSLTAIGVLQQILDEEPMAVGVRGELRFRLAQLRYNAGDDGSWREEMGRAVAELSRRPDLAAHVMISLAWPSYGDGDVEDDLAWLERAVRTVEQTRDPVARIAVHSQRAAILLSVGDPAGWIAVDDLPAQGQSVDETLALLRGYHGLAMVTLSLGHLRRTEAFLDEAARLHRELEDVWWDPWGERTRLSLDWRTGRWDGLEARARDLAEVRSGRVVLSVGSEMILASLQLSRGEVAEAASTFAAILEQAQDRRWMSARVSASAGLARAHLARDDAAEALRVATVGLDVVRTKGVWIWGASVVPVALRALLACGRPGDARALAEEFAAGVRARDAPAARAASTSCDALVAEAEGDRRAAARLFANAERVWNALPCPHESARAREAQARCLRDENGDAADRLLVDALQTYESLGATCDAARVRANLRSRGLAPPSAARGGRRAYGNDLSPREAEIARLAGLGHKNREIAQTLFISPRTVEAHVASVLKKLGVASRQDLASEDLDLDEPEKYVAAAKNT